MILSVYGPDAELYTVREYRGFVLEIMTRGYRSTNSVMTHVAIVRVVAANAQPSLCSRISMAVATMSSTGFRKAPPPATTWVQATQAITIRTVIGAARLATFQARSRTASVVFIE